MSMSPLLSLVGENREKVAQHALTGASTPTFTLLCMDALATLSTGAGVHLARVQVRFAAAHKLAVHGKEYGN